MTVGHHTLVDLDGLRNEKVQLGSYLLYVCMTRAVSGLAQPLKHGHLRAQVLQPKGLGATHSRSNITTGKELEYRLGTIQA